MIEIYGTIGPSCESIEVLKEMISEGLTGMRLNLSHTSLEKSRSRVENYMKACQEMMVQPEFMIDLRGPGQRIGYLNEAVKVFPGDEVILKCRKKADERPVVSVSPSLLEALEPGDRIVIHDGYITLEVIEELPPMEPPVRNAVSEALESVPSESAAEDSADIAADGSEHEEEAIRPGRLMRWLCRTVSGGIIRSQQSIKIVGKDVFGECITADDLKNLDLAESMGVTAVMQPFVRSGENIREVRAALTERGLNLRIFAKIESMSAFQNLDDILPEADVIVIARGDLGNAMPLWELPGVQKTIARKCREAGKPFMVVTQMLTSMMNNDVPTRAEVSDIFNAVLDGASYVMVTGETSVGHYPVPVIRYLTKTAHAAEHYMHCSRSYDNER